MRKFSGHCEIKEVLHITEKIFSLVIDSSLIAETGRPGQFVQVKIPGDSASIWPRPFSIHRIDGDSFTITVKKFGRITNLLERKKPGDKLFINGPLGNGFDLPESGREIYFIAGGVGLPPLHFFCEKLLSEGWSKSQIHFYSGAKTVSELFGHKELEASGIDYIAATDDGSFGIKGYVTEPLSVELTRRRTGDNSFVPVIYGCGPVAMLRKVAELSYGLDSMVSLEQLMPCGWGVCNGCAVKLKLNSSAATEDNRDFALARVCKEGPVFKASEVIWD